MAAWGLAGPASDLKLLVLCCCLLQGEEEEEQG